jgi:hypothetical protein
VRVEDVEAVASIHQHLGEQHVADDRVDDQRVLARVEDVVRVILTAEGDGVLRPVEEGGRSLFRNEDLVLLPLVLVVGHIHGRSPKMRKTFSTADKLPASPSPPSFLASPSFAAARL